MFEPPLDGEKVTPVHGVAFCHADEYAIGCRG